MLDVSAPQQPILEDKVTTVAFRSEADIELAFLFFWRFVRSEFFEFQILSVIKVEFSRSWRAPWLSLSKHFCIPQLNRGPNGCFWHPFGILYVVFGVGINADIQPR